jgi:signal transduction histidine kinase
VLLFLGSLGVLLFNALSPLLLPQQEAEVRRRLRAAGRRLSEGAASLDLAGAPSASPDEVNRQLAEVAERVLRDFPGIEGGFYLADGDRFAGFAYPTGPHPLAPPPRNDPPPPEAPYLRVLARQSLDLDAEESRVSVQDVGPSRVVFLTEPVGAERPARLAAWLMFRLTGPEQLEGTLRRYALSSALALGGVALSLALTWNLGRSLRRQRREQERLRDELRRAEHLAAQGRLLAGVAHEVRNPLAGIRSTVQLWQRLPAAARTPRSMDAVVAAVDRLDALVRRLLFFSRADHAERRPVDVNHILAEALDLIAAEAAEQGVVLKRDLAADLPPVCGSANALRQAVLNLLTNALQAMPHGGHLCCASRRRPGNAVEVRVSDTGPGVPDEVRAHLFEPFATGRPDGTGLGLALCREIVQNHGGRVELEATGAAGATFLVALPARAPAGEEGPG